MKSPSRTKSGYAPAATTENCLASNQSSGKGYRILSGGKLGLIFQWSKMMKLNAIFLQVACCTSEDGIHTSFSQ